MQTRQQLTRSGNDGMQASLSSVRQPSDRQHLSLQTKLPFMSQSTSPPLGIIAKEKLSKTTRQLWRITKAFFRSERRGRARALLILLLALSVSSVGVTVLTSYAVATS